MKHEEDKFQAQAFQWLWNTFPETRGTFFHVPNETTEGARIAAIRKAKGVLAGVPDNVWLWRGKTHLLEFKTEKGTLTDSQKRIFTVLENNGFPVTVLRSLEEFKKYILTNK